MPIFLNKTHRCLFIHIPKTGGYAIRNGLFRGEIEGPYFENTLPREFDALPSFAFVRNPFDRVISAWKMFTTGVQNSDWQLPRDHDPDLTLQDVLELARNADAPFGHPHYNKMKMTNLVRLRNHVLPQLHPYLALEKAKHIGRFETYEADLQRICNEIGLKYVRPPRMHVTARTNYRDYFSPTTINLAREIYRDDLDRFGYDF